MDDLIGRVVANRGADRAVAASAVDIIPQLLIPQLGATGAPMGIGTQLIKSRRGMERIQAVTRKTMTFARQTAREDAVGEIVDAIPRLGRLV
jgi:hypothetical protein